MPIRVAVMVMEPFVIRKVVVREGKKVELLYGLLYDIWNKVKQINNLNVEEIVMDGNKISYDDLCDDISRDKYDMAVGNISVVARRVEKVFFTRPIYLNELNILYKPTQSKIKLFGTLFVTTFLPPLILLLVLGVGLGYLLWYVDRARGRKRAILSSIASMFGEMGYVSERSNLSTRSMIVAFIILLISYYYTIFLQAITVDKVMKETDKSEISKETIEGNRVLSLKGSALGERMKQYGVVTIQRDLDVDNLVQYYLAHSKIYKGILFDYHISLRMADKYNLKVSTDNYGFDEIAFPINRGKAELLHLMSDSLVHLQKSGYVMSKCQMYMGEDNSYLCSL